MTVSRPCRFGAIQIKHVYPQAPVIHLGLSGQDVEFSPVKGLTPEQLENLEVGFNRHQELYTGYPVEVRFRKRDAQVRMTREEVEPLLKQLFRQSDVSALKALQTYFQALNAILKDNPAYAFTGELPKHFNGTALELLRSAYPQLTFKDGLTWPACEVLWQTLEKIRAKLYTT